MTLPSPSEVAAAGDDLSLLALAGLAQAVFFAVFACLCGDQAPPSLQLFGLLGTDAVRRALEHAQVLDDNGEIRRLHPEEQRRAALVWRAARHRQGLPDDQDPLPAALASQEAEQSKFLAPPKPRSALSTPTDPAKASVTALPPLTRRSAAKLLEGLKSAAGAADVLAVKGTSYSHGVGSLRSIFANGTDLGSAIPKSRWDHDSYFDPDGKKYTGIYARHAAITDLPGPTDHTFFGLSEEEASEMDPNQRSCLNEGFRSVKTAKMTRQSLRNAQVGVYVGSMNFDYNMLASGMLDRGNVSLTASRLSHALGLRGPALFMDTGCSSSLVAADVAAGHVRRRRITMGLALGVNHLLNPYMFSARCSISLLSRVGHSAAFNTSADGYLVGEGCGALVLGWAKTASGSRPRWRGSQVMQDGRSAQLTAPSGPAQQELLRETLLRAGTQPAEVVCSECQANGSQLGDPIETGAIDKIQLRAPRTGPLQLMSGKTNKGHGEGVAGMTTILKIILLLEDKLAAPLVHLNRLNEHVDIGNSVPVIFASESLGFPQLMPGQTLQASGSSFGFGGVNAHAILEAWPEQQLVAALPGVAAVPVAQGTLAAPVLPVAAAPQVVQPTLSPEDARYMVRSITQKAIEEDIPDMDVALAESGLDSLSAVELRNSLQRETKLSLPGTLMFDYPSMQAIADFLVEESAAAAPAAPALVQPAPVAAVPAPAQQAQPLQAAPAANAPAQAAPKMSKGDVKQLIASTLKAALDEVPDMETSLTESGLDSLSAVEVRNKLQASLGVAMPGTLLFDHPSVAELTDFVAGEVQAS